MSSRTFQVTVAALLLLPMMVDAQVSDRVYRRTGVHNANQVRTVFGNWGVIGQPSSGGPRGAWKNDNNGYLGDVSPIVGAEVNWQGKIFQSVVSVPVNRPGTADTDPSSGKYWTFEPQDGYFNANKEKVAMSTDAESWPPSWPDKLTDPVDPGWRGSWNGYFGKRINADQESYFVLDDNNDERWNFAAKNTKGVSFKPDSLNPLRNGLALEMRVRGMQWSQFLAKDNIFWLYEITNTGTTDYNKAVFGMLVGTYVGVTGTDDSPREYDDDWSFYDVQTNLTYTGDFPRSNARNPLWVGPVGMVGYAFLESPGNPYDGIDNDGDSDTTGFSGGAVKFNQTSFDSVTINAGMQIVLINQDFSRTVYNVTAVDSQLVTTRGLSLYIRPGITRLVEGNVLRDVSTGNTFINPNAYDGVDNDFDGLIDENSFVHYRQVKRTNTVPPKTLIDVLRPVRYINYATGAGTNPQSMIDEKRTDRFDNDQDWVLGTDDVGRDGIDGTGDGGEGDGVPTSGIDAFGNDTGLPGEPNIDKTDVSESDQIGLTSFYYFTPASNVFFNLDSTLWQNLAPGFFSVPETIVENRPEGGQDGDFFYGSGYFPLLAGTTERFSLALVYGGGKGGGIEEDITDLLKNKQTVQKIYNSNYQFPQPPDKPTLTAVPGDKQVTLYWDRKAEATVDPVLKVRDFEGYRIYRSTDPDFSDIFTITDATGSPQGYRPLAQFDLKNSVSGYFRADDELFQGSSGFSFYLGGNSGLSHSYVDRGVENGRRYYYALVAYDRGDELIGIFPSENTKIIRVSSSGEVTKDVNTVIVVPNAKVAGYERPEDAIPLDVQTRYGTGSVLYRILDETKLTGHSYRVTFLDTQVDRVDNNGNGLIDAADSSEYLRQTTQYFVYDENEIIEDFFAQDTALVKLNHKHIIRSSVVVRTSNGVILSPTSYNLDTTRGEIRGAAPGAMPTDAKYSISYTYYPIHGSPYIKSSPFVAETNDAEDFDGLTLMFENQWDIVLIDSLSRWRGTNAYVFNFVPFEYYDDLGVLIALGYARPADYDIVFSNTVVDTSYEDPVLFTPAVPVNFRIFNRTEKRFVKFLFGESVFDGKLGAIEELVLVEPDSNGTLRYTWDIFFINKFGESVDVVYDLKTGDTLQLRTSKPFREGDTLRLAPALPRVNAVQAAKDLGRVRVVPNPYVAASAHESPLPPGVTVGRLRRVDFTRLPARSKVHIYTARGEHVISLQHDGDIEDGTISWNLKSKENLDIAFGVYFYVVESDAGTQTGKMAIIK
ncbi:MAG: hypothetical protein A3H45_02820 [Ignavibacteria bacterium RIFCSPLOWO2_02_FULL_55_14]|nr:MAG: hypothetical protein A3H45_02820 [Ignavibacteria bacterium RIFCSPLOWO2_02_FULL_55_14]